MKRHIEVHAYLAGPDVFYPDAIEIGKVKKNALAEVGIRGHFPFDNEIPKEAFADKRTARNTIANANEQMMLDCCKDGQVGIILANMTPYHGPSMDVGTGFEVGFMSALSHVKKNVIVIGYTDAKKNFMERVIDHFGGDKHITKQPGGQWVGPDGNTLEDFDAADNLMITHAIEKTGGRVCNSFNEAVQLAKELSEKKIAELTGPEQYKRSGNQNGGAGRGGNS